MIITLRRAIVLAILFGLLVPGMISSMVMLFRQQEVLLAQIEADQKRITEILVLGMQEPLWNLSPDTGKPLLDSVMSDERIVRVVVQDKDLGMFLEQSKPDRRMGQLKVRSQNVVREAKIIGQVSVEMDDGLYLAAIHQYTRYYLISVAIQFAMSLGLILLLLHRRVLEPVKRLMGESIRLAQRDLATPFNWKRQDELGRLGQSLEITRQSLHNLFEELETKNRELQVDLQQRKQFEQALRASEDRYRRLVESTKVVPWEARPGEWRFTYVGPQAEVLLGYPLHIWYSEAFLSSHLHPDDQHMAYQLFGNDFGPSHTIDFECRMIANDGREVWVMLVATTIHDHSGAPHLQGYLIDTSARKSNEIELSHYRNHLEDLVEQRTKALAAANKELEAFSYSVSHDLRSPLRSVDGFSQVLLEDYSDVLDDTGKQYLNRIRRSTQHMSSLIDDLLNLSKLSRSEIRAEAINLADLADEVIHELRIADPARKVSISVMPNLPAMADPKLMRQVLQNLLGNAWKFTGKVAFAEIGLGVTQLDGQNTFYVSDNGAGFDMSYADKLFGAFQRLHSVNEFEGTGIGLAIVQRILQRHGGKVWAQSAPQHGATFYFTLPPHTEDIGAIS